MTEKITTLDQFITEAKKIEGTDSLESYLGTEEKGKDELLQTMMVVRSYYHSLLAQLGMSEGDAEHTETIKEMEAGTYGASYGCPHCGHHWDTRVPHDIIICPKCRKVVE